MLRIAVNPAYLMNDTLMLVYGVDKFPFQVCCLCFLN